MSKVISISQKAPAPPSEPPRPTVYVYFNEPETLSNIARAEKAMPEYPSVAGRLATLDAQLRHLKLAVLINALPENVAYYAETLAAELVRLAKQYPKEHERLGA